MNIRKKKIWFLLIAAIVWLIWFYSRPLISLNEAMPELDITNIHNVMISDARYQTYHLESEETEQFISILDNSAMKKKIIPNIPAFNDDAYILFRTPNIEESYQIRIDYKRNIIGIIEHPKMMKQYILEENSDLFSFIQSYLNTNEVVD